MEIAKLHNTGKLKIPIIIQRFKLTVPQSFSAGIHGDEINGVEIVRQQSQKKSTSQKRNYYLHPIINMFGFINMSRQFLMAEI
jgi:succinylglutamate desuccinylase